MSALPFTLTHPTTLSRRLATFHDFFYRPWACLIHYIIHHDPNHYTYNYYNCTSTEIQHQHTAWSFGSGELFLRLLGRWFVYLIWPSQRRTHITCHEMKNNDPNTQE